MEPMKRKNSCNFVFSQMGVFRHEWMSETWEGEYSFAYVK
jgi:hypothetical protein